MKNTPQLSWDYVNANVPITVAVDVMGGDHGPAVTVPAVLQYLQRDIHCSAVLLGRKESLQIYRSDMEQLQSRLRVIETNEAVEMHEPVATALRNKKRSSLHLMAQQVRDGEAQAAVSAGNTGALMAISRFILKTLPGIERPAIATVLPTIKNGRVYVLDLGANVDCSASQLLQFAWMGSLFAGALEEKPRPIVGLLNVGKEEQKGNDVVREAAELLKVSGLNYYGFVEGDALCLGEVDVVVCDGFSGNVALKSAEGMAKMLAKILREEFSRNWYTRLCALMALPTINSFKQRVDPRAYNGAGLLGLKGVVFKSHGSADVFAFEYAIHRAVESARHKLVEHIGEQLNNATMPSAKAT